MKARFVALAVTAALGLGSVSAFAQDHRYNGRGDAAWQHQRGDWGANHRYTAPRTYAPSYGYRHDNGDVAGALVLGAITGALLGQATNNYYAPPAAYYAPPAQYYAPPAQYYAPPATVYPGYGYYGN
jgi:hypothetical protein